MPNIRVQYKQSYPYMWNTIKKTTIKSQILVEWFFKYFSILKLLHDQQIINEMTFPEWVMTKD